MKSSFLSLFSLAPINFLVIISFNFWIWKLIKLIGQAVEFGL